jgi:hypothetical protein
MITHTPFSQVDPFTQVINRLWAILEADATFCAMVKPGNRIKLTAADGHNPIKQNVQPGDLPEVIIEPTTSVDNAARTSTSMTVLQNFSVKAATNDMRINAAALPLRWVLLKAMFAGGDRLDLDFVVRTRLTTSLLNTYDPVENRGTEGWTVLMTVAVEMEFARAGQTLAD